MQAFKKFVEQMMVEVPNALLYNTSIIAVNKVEGILLDGTCMISSKEQGSDDAYFEASPPPLPDVNEIVALLGYYAA